MQSISKYGLYVMAALYVLAGFNHFWHPGTYLKIMPHFLPWPEVFNIVVGVLEMVLGGLLFFKSTRNIAAWGLIILLILIFPANIQMAIDYHKQSHPFLWAAYLRLPLQPVLIWLAFICTNWYRMHKTYSMQL